MGIRTGAYEKNSNTLHKTQLNRNVRSSVDGTAVRKVLPQQDEPVRINKQKRTGASASQKRALRRQKRLFVALGTVATLAVIGLAGVMLITADKHTKLNSSILKNEGVLSELTVSNEAKEYEIYNSVDLNEVIRVATEELGMVRMNPSQIVTYSVKNTEYLLQVAAVPME